MTEPIESRLQALAKEFQYPPTPSVTDAVMTRLLAPLTHPRRNRQLAWALTMLIVVLAGLMSVPPVRAAVLEFIQIGIVRIFPAPVNPTPTAEPIVPVTVTPAAQSSDLIPILDQLAGEMTLEEAQQKVGFSILLPAYPTDLGEPDRVYVQDMEGEMVVLVWIDPQQPERVSMSLHFIPTDSWGIDKVKPTLIQSTLVNGQEAIWAKGPYPIRFYNNNLEIVRLMEGYVLIWAVGDVTYRLETDLPLEEAIKVAESLVSP